MKNNKQQTAIDLAFEYFDSISSYISPNKAKEFNDKREEFKIIEKRQIQIAFNHGAKIPDKKQKVFERWMDTDMSAERRNKLIAEIPKTGQKYYKETFE